MTFKGVPDAYFDFIRTLKDGAALSAADRAQAARCVEAPLSALAEALAPHVAAISPHFTADPEAAVAFPARRRRDGDLRAHGAVRFLHEAGEGAPMFFAHLEPDENFYGAGLWSPDDAALSRIRARIRDEGEAWLRAKTAAAFDETFYDARFGAEGKSLTAAPPGFPEDHPHIEDIKRKSFFAMRRASRREAQSGDFADAVAATFRDAAPFVEFLCGALRLKF